MSGTENAEFIDFCYREDPSYLGKSQRWVCDLEARALAKLREALS